MLAEVEQGTSTHNLGVRDFVANQSNGVEPGAALSPALTAYFLELLKAAGSDDNTRVREFVTDEVVPGAMPQIQVG